MILSPLTKHGSDQLSSMKAENYLNLAKLTLLFIERPHRQESPSSRTEGTEVDGMEDIQGIPH